MYYYYVITVDLCQISVHDSLKGVESLVVIVTLSYLTSLLICTKLEYYDKILVKLLQNACNKLDHRHATNKIT